MSLIEVYKLKYKADKNKLGQWNKFFLIHTFLAIFLKFLKKNWGEQLKVKQIIIERTPIPGHTGDLLLIYTGGLLLTLYNHFDKEKEPEIKVVAPYEWQKVALPYDIYQRHKNKREIKVFSKQNAYNLFKNHWQAELIKTDDDIADAVNMGYFYDQIEGREKLGRLYIRYEKYR